MAFSPSASTGQLRSRVAEADRRGDAVLSPGAPDVETAALCSWARVKRRLQLDPTASADPFQVAEAETGATLPMMFQAHRADTDQASSFISGVRGGFPRGLDCAR